MDLIVSLTLANGNNKQALRDASELSPSLLVLVYTACSIKSQKSLSNKNLPGLIYIHRHALYLDRQRYSSMPEACKHATGKMQQ